MSKVPIRYPRWATDADPGDIIEPPSGAREVGYQTGQRPPAQWFNHHFNLIGGWVDFLRGPSLANWREQGLANEIDNHAFIAGSEDEPGFVIAGNAGAATTIYVSDRGEEWEERTRLADNTIGNVRGLVRTGGVWLLWTDNSILWTPDGAGGAFEEGGVANWTDGSVADVAGVAYNATAGRWLAILETGAAFRRSSNGQAWTPASTTGSPTGLGLSVVWDNAYFVAITSTGQIWRTTSVDTNLVLSATLTTATTWRLVTGENKLVAYRTGSSIAMQISLDHGSTWAAVILPSDMLSLSRIEYIDGLFVATATVFPFVWVSNDLIAWNRAFIPAPQDETAYAFDGVAMAHRAVVLLGSNGQFVLASTRAHDAANGDPTTFTTPVARSDAAYFRGIPLAEQSPANSQVWAYNSTTGEYELATVSGVSVGDPKAFDRTFTFAGGAYDYTTDSNFASAAFPDDETDQETSAILGDGITVPYFYAVHTPDFASLARTVGGALRLGLNATGTDPWPGNQDAPAVMIPLPVSCRIEVEFTVRLGAAALDNGNKFAVCLARDSGGGNTEQLCRIQIALASATTANETVSIWGNAYSSNGVNSYVTAPVFARHYRIVLDGPNLAVYGGAVGASVANTLIHGRSFAARGLSRADISLTASVASSVAVAGLYCELANLHYEGVES
jgi:hypothetical protein